jgi:hypothetical protein
MATEATAVAGGALWSRLVDNVTMYASFADSPNAEMARGGNGTASLNDAVVRHEASGGRAGGGCLVFHAAHHGWTEDEFTFPADGNFPYSSSAFEGTISFWALSVASMTLTIYCGRKARHLCKQRDRSPCSVSSR